MNVLLVAVGGAIGAAVRYLIGAWVMAHLGPDFPWGTFIINVSGSFLIGVVLALVQGGVLPSGARLFVAVGILGGYTTFSTYGYETMGLISDGDLRGALLNALGQVLAGLTAVYFGVVIGRVLGGT